MKLRGGVVQGSGAITSVRPLGTEQADPRKSTPSAVHNAQCRYCSTQNLVQQGAFVCMFLSRRNAEADGIVLHMRCENAGQGPRRQNSRGMTAS